MVKPGASGGEDASSPLGEMVQTPHGLQRPLWWGHRLASSWLPWQESWSSPASPRRTGVPSLWHLLLWVGWARSRCHLSLSLSCALLLSWALWLEKADVRLFPHSYFFLCLTHWHLWVVGFFCSKSGFMQEKSRQLPAAAFLQPMLVCSALRLGSDVNFSIKGSRL